MFGEQNKPEEYYDEYFLNDWEVDDRDYSDVSEESMQFANELIDLFFELSENEIDEQFTTISNAKYHFNKHCIGKFVKKSSRQTVAYDTMSFNDFISYEDQLDKKIKSPDHTISDLSDTQYVLKVFRALFEGNKTIVFKLSCGFINNEGRVAYALHSWANNSTTNYPQNTIDFITRSPDDLTVALYPIDANYLITKLNNCVKRSNISKKDIF